MLRTAANTQAAATWGDVPHASHVDPNTLAERVSIRCGDADYYLGIIAERTLLGLNGAGWQIATWHKLVDDGLSRDDAIRRLVRVYRQRSYASTPVHTWPVGG